MTLTIELTPAVEQQLTAAAAANGKALRDYVNEILARTAQENRHEPRQELDFADRLRAIQEFNQAAAEMASNLPILSDYATTREGIYEGYAEHLLGHSTNDDSEVPI